MFVEFVPHTLPHSALRSRLDTPADTYLQEKSAKYWIRDGQLTLRNHLLRKPNNNIAKNVILFLGDGMSIPTLAAARAYMGQKQGLKGEESRLSFEEFPYVGLSKVRFCIGILSINRYISCFLITIEILFLWRIFSEDVKSKKNTHFSIFLNH